MIPRKDPFKGMKLFISPYPNTRYQETFVFHLDVNIQSKDTCFLFVQVILMNVANCFTALICRDCPISLHKCLRDDSPFFSLKGHYKMEGSDYIFFYVLDLRLITSGVGISI